MAFTRTYSSYVDIRLSNLDAVVCDEVTYEIKAYKKFSYNAKHQNVSGTYWQCVVRN
ncbi:hypothetical protein ACJMK2_039996 [Sinanodonta woodiana]|uniref:Uncharacterized protein n=1 Tax=Sinanodonta woodiana TaxID=1069815 RepID=A0ABD3WET7_SINWO